MKRHLHWFRHDLRLDDNPALTQAARDADQVLALYILCPEQERQHGRGARQLGFIEDRVARLREQLQAVGVSWIEAECPTYADLPELLAKLVNDHSIDALFANHEYGVNEIERDEAVGRILPVPFHRMHGECVIPPGSVVNTQGNMFRVFTPFRNAWMRLLQAQGYALSPSPWKPATLETPGNNSQAWSIDESGAHSRLADFCRNHLHDYDRTRDYPARDGTSALSPYLAIGMLSPGQCLQAIETELGFLPMSPGETGFAWLNELVWREFYRHLMSAFPRVSKDRCFNPQYDRLQWRDDEDRFQAWCGGRTGYPIVDAAMRCLNTTGWMHNRLRMIVASFLTKDLEIDWRRGERYFMQQLIDADFASNNGGWQWAAGTGADAAPYFRIFNPTSQGQKFDPDGSFVKTWLPELEPLPAKQVHSPQRWLAARGLEDRYPPPIVDHAEARKLTLARYQRIKEKSS